MTDRLPDLPSHTMDSRPLAGGMPPSRLARLSRWLRLRRGVRRAGKYDASGKYDAWIDRARKARDAKVHGVLRCFRDGVDGDVVGDDVNDVEITRDYFSDFEDDAFAGATFENDSAVPLLTASATRYAVLTGELDPRRNVAVLSRRCRKYGRHPSVNAVAEELYGEAGRRAATLSNRRHYREFDFLRTQRRAGVAPYDDFYRSMPLFGVPVSVKEHITVRRCYATAGLACRLRSRKLREALVVEVIRAAGAIPLVTSNVPQLLMLPETTNRIWGRTSNPWDLTRTPGGSSGGDAALVAMGCVPLAVASDAAGSIRIPASFCGVVGFKPTPTRMSSRGVVQPRLDAMHQRTR